MGEGCAGASAWWGSVRRRFPPLVRIGSRRADQAQGAAGKRQLRVCDSLAHLRAKPGQAALQGEVLNPSRPFLLPGLACPWGLGVTGAGVAWGQREGSCPGPPFPSPCFCLEPRSPASIFRASLCSACWAPGQGEAAVTGASPRLPVVASWLGRGLPVEGLGAGPRRQEEELLGAGNESRAPATAGGRGATEGGLPFENRKPQTQTGSRGRGPSLGRGSGRDTSECAGESHGAYADKACLYVNESVCMQMRREGILFSGLP